MKRLNLHHFRQLMPQAQARLLLVMLGVVVVLLVMPWPVGVAGLNSLFMIGMPLGYFLVVLFFPGLLVALLFWFAARQEAIERHLSETEND